MDDHYKTPLIERATRMAAANHPLKPGAIFHSKPNLSSPHSKRSACPVPNTPPAHMHELTSPAISDFAPIRNASTQDSATGHHAKPTTSSRTDSKQHGIAIKNAVRNTRGGPLPKTMR